MDARSPFGSDWAERWPEGSLRDGSSVYYAHPLNSEDRARLRTLLATMRAEGGTVLVRRVNDDPPTPGYPSRYLEARVAWTEADL